MRHVFPEEDIRKNLFLSFYDHQWWSSSSLIHNDNKPIQYMVIFHCSKNENIQMNNLAVFLIFAQNIDCEYTLEPPQ